MATPKNDVCIGMITSGNVHMAVVQSLLGAVMNGGARWIYIQQSGPYLDDARNNLIGTFMNEAFKDCDRLLMVDSDVEFTSDDIQRLVDDNRPVVSGVYHSMYEDGIHPVVYEWSDYGEKTLRVPDKRCKTGYRLEYGRTMTPIKTWPATAEEQPLVKVDGCGAGFLMIKRDVIMEFIKHHEPPQIWFAEDVINGTHFGEDLCFNVRCAELGIDTWVDRRVQLAHHKNIRLQGS